MAWDRDGKPAALTCFDSTRVLTRPHLARRSVLAVNVGGELEMADVARGAAHRLTSRGRLALCAEVKSMRCESSSCHPRDLHPHTSQVLSRS
jgi:hypothetical protein